MAEVKQKRFLAFDFETIADRTMLSCLPEVKANGNLKDQAKIDADIAAKKQKQILDMGLDPMLNLICAAGWKSKGGSGCLFIDSDGTPEGDKFAEKKLISDFWELLKDYDHFITFNGRSFDMRCLLLHGMQYGVQPSIDIDMYRYNRGNHIDMRLVLAGNEQFAKGKLDFFGKKYLGRGKKEGIDGALVQSYYDMGLFDDIKEYVEDDADLVYELCMMAIKAGLVVF